MVDIAKQFVKVYTPELDLNQNVITAIIKGAETITPNIEEIPQYSNSGLSATINIPSNVVVGRRIRLVQPVSIAFAGDSNDVSRNLLQSGQDAFRAFPLHSAMENLEIRLNGQSFTLAPAKLIKSLLQFNNNARNLGERSMSLTPSALDNIQAYSQLDGAINNPLAGYYDTLQNSQSGRGAFPYSSFSNTTTTATIEADLSEDLMIHPLVFGTEDDHQGFFHLKDFYLNIRWRNNPENYMWSHSPASSSTIDSITVTFLQPRLEMIYYTPSMGLASMIPEYAQYPFDNIQYITETNTPSLAPDATYIIRSQVQELSELPRYVVVFAKKDENTFTYEDPDAFAKIVSVKVKLGNRSNLLSNATDKELYNMSRRNGLSVSWADWSGDNMYSYLGNTTNRLNGRGSVLKLELGNDLELYEQEAAGLNEKKTLQVEATLKNVHPTDNISFQFYVLTITPGRAVLYGNSCFKEVGLFDAPDVLGALMDKDLSYEDLDKQLMSGGVSFSKLAKKAKKGLKVAAPIGREAVKLGAPQYLGLYDAGTKAALGSGLVGGAICGGGRVGGAGEYMGGMPVSRGRLRSMMDDYDLD